MTHRNSGREVDGSGGAARTGIVQIALSVLDGERSDDWYASGLGMLPAGTLQPTADLSAVQGIPDARVANLIWLVDANPFFQFEIFQYASRPVTAAARSMRERPRLRPHRRLGGRPGRDARAAAGVTANQHNVTTSVITESTDGAEDTTYLIVQHRRDGAEDGAIAMGGTYYDKFRRENGAWRIYHRELIGSWRSGNPNVLIRT